MVGTSRDNSYPPLDSTLGYLKNRLPSEAPNDVNDSIIPGITHLQSPNVAAFSWGSSPAATELESIVMHWMGKMLKLPSSSGTGVVVMHDGSTCEAVVCTLAAARDEALKKSGDDKITKLVVYGSDQTHSTVQKGAKLVGILPSNFRALPTSKSSHFALSPETLLSAIENDRKKGLIPLYLCGTVGTTTSRAVDPIMELGKIAKKYNMWYHIDAAYAGSALICPDFRDHLNGVELADSWSVNLHKWFLTNPECCCLWIKQPKALTDSLSSTPECSRNKASESGSVIDYKDWQIALSRRFRAIELWEVIGRYGFENLINNIRSDVKMAELFESLVRKDERFEVVVPTMFAMVCFRLKPKKESEGTDLNRKLLETVNSSGRASMTDGVIGGVYVIRCAIGTTLTEEHDIKNLWKRIQEKADKLKG